MNIRVVEDCFGFKALKSDWDRLCDELITENRFEWNYKWWQHLGSNKMLKILVAEEKGKVIGIAPLYIEQVKLVKAFSLKKLSLLGGDVTDYIDFLVDKNFGEESVFSALFNYALDMLDYDILDFGQINTGYPRFAIWQKYLENFGVQFKHIKECHGADLSQYTDYDDYYAQLPKGMKKDFRNKKNKVKNDGINVEFEVKTEVSEEDIRKIGRLNIERQKFLREKGFNKRDSLYADKDKLEFIKDFFCTGESKTKRLCYLNFNENIIAYVLYFKEQESIHLWNAAFDPRYEIYSPSKLLYNEIIRSAFENNIKYIDFMRGNESYKLNWTNFYTINHYVFMKNSIKALLLYMIKDRIPKFIIDRIRKSDIKLLESGESKI